MAVDIRFRSALRWTGCFWFLPLVFAGTCLVASQDMLFTTGYPAGDVASASVGLALVGPIIAGFTATQFRGFSRLARSLRSSRTGVRSILALWWLPVVGSPLTVCAAVAVSARTVPSDPVSWSLLGLDFVTILACAVLGLAFAWGLPIVLAVPGVTMLTYVWLSYTASSASALFHNLNSTFPVCCDPSTQPASTALTASAILCGLICLGVGLLALPRRWARSPRLLVAPALALVLAVGFGGAAAVALGSGNALTLEAVEPRTTSLECRVASGIRTCLWPEVDRVAELVRAATDLNAIIARWGLDPIRAMTQGTGDGDATVVDAGDQLSTDDLRFSVNAGYAAQAVGCASAYGPYRDERVAVLGLASGLDARYLADSFGPATLEVAREKLRASPDALRAWFLDRTGATECEDGW